MIEKIQKYCKNTNQPIPQSIGEITRTVFESLALKYTIVLESLSEIKGKQVQGLNITGGGIRNRFLNQLISNSLNMPIVTGQLRSSTGKYYRSVSGLVKSKTSQKDVLLLIILLI